LESIDREVDRIKTRKVSELDPSKFSKKVMPSLSDEEYQSLKKKYRKEWYTSTYRCNSGRTNS